jgi:hypothetical protein
MGRNRQGLRKPSADLIETASDKTATGLLADYRWTICEGVQIHLRSPQSYATLLEAKEDADKAMSKFAAH